MHQFQCVSDGNAVLSSHNEEELKLTLHQKQQQQQQRKKKGKPGKQKSI